MVVNIYMEHLRRNLSGGVQAYPADAITLITYMYMYIYTKEITLDPKFDVESNGMVYLSSSSSLGHDIGPLTARVNVFVRLAHATSPGAGRGSAGRRGFAWG